VSDKRFDPRNSATDRSALTSGLLAGIVGFAAFTFIWGIVAGIAAGVISAVAMGAIAVRSTAGSTAASSSGYFARRSAHFCALAVSLPASVTHLEYFSKSSAFDAPPELEPPELDEPPELAPPSWPASP
jgi:hypothetical protein